MIYNQIAAGANLEALLMYDPHLFDPMAVPAGIDKMRCISAIRRNHGLAPLYHPDPDYMKNALYWWSHEQMPIWEKMLATTKFDYNPIWNTEVSEKTTDITERERADSQQGTQMGHAEQKAAADHYDSNQGGANDSGEHHDTGKSTTDTTTSRNTDTTTDTHTENKISAENVDTYQPDSTADTHTTSNEDMDETVQSVTDTKADGTTKADSSHWDKNTARDTSGAEQHTRGESWQTGNENEKTTFTHGWSRQGNIGVMSTQDLIKQEREVVLFNIYRFIADSFHKEFCLDIY